MREDRSKAMAIFDEHDYLLHFWNELTDEERRKLVEQFTSYKIREIDREFKLSGRLEKPEGVEPIDLEHHAVAANIDAERMKEYWNIGLYAISRGEVAVLCLAGGQATRLGATEPKGTLSLGFMGNSRADSLLAIHAARIARLQDLARSLYPNSVSRIWWIVMTSETTRKETLLHLSHILPTIGLSMMQVVVIVQGTLPCYDINGGLFLTSKYSFAVAPNGNGGVFKALLAQFPLATVGIKYIHTYCVDNVLCRVADPHFIGYCIKKGVDCAAKAVEKTDPMERVGVICQTRNGPHVIEYSELPPELAKAKDDLGHLKFRLGNIANHFFTAEFFIEVAHYSLPYHRAFKKIPFIDRMTGIPVIPETENGYKLEHFVFDVFKYAKNFHVWEVKRSEEFSPLKNKDSVGKECMTTCRADFYALCMKWLEQARVPVKIERPVFIHPLCSYMGEGLEVYQEKGLTDDLLP